MSAIEALFYTQPVHIRLSKSPKGRYHWEISVHGPTEKDTLDIVNRLNAELEIKYGDKATTAPAKTSETIKGNTI
jgi:hypothetical protein